MFFPIQINFLKLILYNDFKQKKAVSNRSLSDTALGY